MIVVFCTLLIVVTTLILEFYRDMLPAAAASQQAEVTLTEVQELCAHIRAYRSNLAVDDVSVIETSLKDSFGLLHLHHVSKVQC